MIVKVVDYDSSWKSSYASEAGLIRNILESQLINIFHIGSTAVNGLKAKPIIDIMPVVEDISQLDSHISDFEALGYEAMGEFGIPGRRYFRKGEENRTHQVHAFQYDNLYDIERHLAVRDYLEAHEKIRREYAVLKTRLAEKFPEDIESYSDGKESFVIRMEKEALKWMYRRRH